MKTFLFMKKCLVVLGLSVFLAGMAQADGWNPFHPRKYAYSLRISRSASYQLLPGDYVEVGIVTKRGGERIRYTLLNKIQVVKISGAPDDVVLLKLAMNKKEILSMRKALEKPEATVALRIVEKQPRPDAEAQAADVLPYLDFEDGSEIARSPR
jgi:hypothetical protein